MFILPVPTGILEPCKQALRSSGAHQESGGEGPHAVLHMTFDGIVMETVLVGCGCQLAHPRVTWEEGLAIKKKNSCPEIGP